MIRNLLILAVVIGWVSVFDANAQVPSLISYQGRLLSDTNLVNGPVSLVLRLYTQASGGALVYEDSNTVDAVDGLYSTLIGDGGYAVPLTQVMTNRELWVEPAVNGIVLSPRERVVAVCYALTASGVSTGAITTAMLANSAVTSAKLANNSVSSNKIVDGSIAFSDLAQNGAAAGQAMVWNGTAWSNAAVSGSGLLSYDESGTFSSPPNANGADSIAQGAANSIGSGSDYSVIGGGVANSIAENSPQSAIGGGRLNTIAPGVTNATIGGGYGNEIWFYADKATVGGGYMNAILATSQYAVIAGGETNIIEGNSPGAVIGGGYRNLVNSSAERATIAGGVQNEVGTGAMRSSIGGGYLNRIMNTAYYGTIPGGNQNYIGVNARQAAIGGGYLNVIAANSTNSVIAGGAGNVISNAAVSATIGGGENNIIQPSASGAMIGGGIHNRLETGADSAVIAGGTLNVLRSPRAVIAGGGENVIWSNSLNSSILGGYRNIVGTNAYYSAVLNGRNNLAAGTGSLAAGRRAKALHAGSFVWADYSDADSATTTSNQFLIRAGGGVGINTNVTPEALTVAGAIVVADSTAATPVAGTIRWTGTDFEGYTGSEWVSLTAGGVTPSGMALIPAGSFVMGATTNMGHESESDETPQHTVYVSAFYMDKYEVTAGLWSNVTAWAAGNGYAFDNLGGGKATNHPVHTVCWYDVVKWCNARSEEEGLTPCYTTNGLTYKTGNNSNVVCNWSANGYRLPTEAEWEKAARGGVADHRFPWSDSDEIKHIRANYYAATNSYAYDTSAQNGYHPTYNDGTTPYSSPAGVFGANGYGLYDMAGNVWEWCWDWYGSAYYASSPGTDPRGASGGSYRVLRGGSWVNVAYSTRVAYRNNDLPAVENNTYGFRCVRGL